MGFAAEAVVDAIAPPQPSARAAADAPDAPSFDAHLDAARELKPDDAETETDNKDGAAGSDAPGAPPPAPAPTQNLIAASLMLQLDASPPAAAPLETTATPVAAIAPAPMPTPSDVAADSAAKSNNKGGPEICAGEAETATPNGADAPKPDAGKAIASPATTEPKPVVAAPASVPLPSTDATAATPQQQIALQTLLNRAPAQPSPPQDQAPRSNEASQQTPQADATQSASATRVAGAADAARDGSARKDSEDKSDGRATSAKALSAAANVTPKDSAGFVPVDAPEAPAPATGGLAMGAAHAGDAQQIMLEPSVARAAPVAAQVAREIVRRFNGETTRFELRLDPPELGRIDVRLEVSRDHRVTAMVSADSPQTLTDLARHARELTQSLQSAGLDLADNGLSFDLRQSKDDAQRGDGDARPRNSETTDSGAADPAPPPRRVALERWRGARVDMMV